MRQPFSSILLPGALAGTLLAASGHRISAQTAAEHIGMGIAASNERDPQAAFRHFEEAIQLEPTNYEANWRAAQALVDIGKQTPDQLKSPERDSLYAQAETIARVAVAADSNGADGHYALALAIGRASLTKSKKERVRRASEIRTEALRAIELNPRHDKAYHVMGRWNAEIMRLSGLTRLFAKAFLGAGIFSRASWDSAAVYLQKAVELAPQDIYHHLELAEVYIDRDRYDDARGELEIVGTLPIFDVLDPIHQEKAKVLLTQIEGKKNKN